MDPNFKIFIFNSVWRFSSPPVCQIILLVDVMGSLSRYRVRGVFINQQNFPKIANNVHGFFNVNRRLGTSTTETLSQPLTRYSSKLVAEVLRFRARLRRASTPKLQLPCMKGVIALIPSVSKVVCQVQRGPLRHSSGERGAEAGPPPDPSCLL